MFPNPMGTLGMQHFKIFLDLALRYGAPGVEMTGLHKDTAAVTQIHFLYGQVRPCFNHCSLLGVGVCVIVVRGLLF